MHIWIFLQFTWYFHKKFKLGVPGWQTHLVKGQTPGFSSGCDIEAGELGSGLPESKNESHRQRTVSKVTQVY